MIGGISVELGVGCIAGVSVSLKSLLERFDFLPLVLLETIVKNCEKAFSEVAAERVLDDMVRLEANPPSSFTISLFTKKLTSLKSKGIRFPGCHNESLAPIFTPPRSVSEVELDLPRQTQHDDIPVQSFTPEQTKEAFDVARNSIELLSTVLSSPQQDVLQGNGWYCGDLASCVYKRQTFKDIVGFQIRRAYSKECWCSDLAWYQIQRDFGEEHEAYNVLQHVRRMGSKETALIVMHEEYKILKCYKNDRSSSKRAISFL
ncbi:hypothetical protein HN51_049940 [Arachis hypogaea]